MSSIWFSHKEYRYDAELKGRQKVFHWSERSEMWDWDNCTVTALSRHGGRVRVVVRSTNIVHSEYMKRVVVIRYMLGFDATDIRKPETGEYNEPPKGNVKGKVYGRVRERWVIQLDEDYFIWEWAEEGKGIEDSNVQKIYDLLKMKKENPDLGDNVFDLETGYDNRIIPVIYQPAIDSWKNFVREIHCHRVGTDEIEVTVLFNNEELRQHAILNRAYEWLRSLVYGRSIDVESFKIILANDLPVRFRFERIYSNRYEIQHDNVHEDKPELYSDGTIRVPEHDIKYYADKERRHPVVFINTANHAMAEHDTNHRLWKWEYVAWEKDSPVVYGEKSRRQIDRIFKPKLKFW